MSFCPLQVDTCNLDAKIWNENSYPSQPSPAGVSTPNSIAGRFFSL